MDLGGDSSEPINGIENDETLEGTSSFDGTKLEINGSSVNEISSLGLVNIDEFVASPLNGEDIISDTPIQNPLEVSETSGETPPTKKGYGLKKWRRIKRENFTDLGSGFDLNRVLKRGLPNTPEAMKPRAPSLEIKQRSEDSAASVRSPDAPDGSAVQESSLDSTLGVGSAFAVGTDSENSADRSSKSSTAASAPRSRHDGHMSGRDKNRVKYQSGKSSSNTIQKVQQVKGRIESGKKFRGERVKIETENSYSSEESDLRSSNVVFTQTGGVYGSSNGRQRPLNFGESNSGSGQASNPQTSRQDRDKYGRENGSVIPDVSADVSIEEKDEELVNHPSLAEWDPLVQSIISLQAVQEALETEIRRFGELAKEPVLPPEDFGSANSDEIERNRSHPLGAQLIDLNQKVNHLECKLEEASELLKVKESRVAELENILNGRETQSGEQPSKTLPVLEDKRIEMEAQLEDLLMQKIEAEIEYLLISRTTQNMKVATKDQISLFEEQKSLSTKQNHMLQKLRQAESKATLLKKHAEELDASCEEIFGNEEILEMQNRVCKYSLCFFVQLVLLFLWVVMVMMQLFPQPTWFVPT